MSLLGTAGNTAIDCGLGKRLLEQWQFSDLWPATREQDTSIAGAPGDPRHFMGFCSEVAYDTFGIFASSLHRHADETDASSARRGLTTETVEGREGYARPYGSDGDWLLR